MNPHFDCIFYYVTDIERAVSFYRDILQLRLTSFDAVAQFDIDGVLFELIPVKPGTKLRGNGNARLCLQVDDIHEAKQELNSQSIRSSTVMKVHKGLLLLFEDPDGNEICLWQSRY